VALLDKGLARKKTQEEEALRKEAEQW